MNPPLTPCTRILAMNMIGDLMRKVGVSIIIILYIYIYIYTHTYTHTYTHIHIYTLVFLFQKHLINKSSLKHGLFEF